MTDIHDETPALPVDVSARLDALVQEVRRQGRAGVAAQAAAESCLEEVQRLAALLRDRPASDPAPAAAPMGEPWLRALLPVFDAMSFSAARASSLRQELARPRWWSTLGLLRRRFGDILAFLSGTEMLWTQLDAALLELGVRVDRDVDVPVDPRRHQVLEVVAARPSQRGRVLEVIRPGYFRGEQCIRETEVRAGAEDDRGN